MHVEISHAKDYHVYEQIYMITVYVVNLSYMIMCHRCLIIHLFIYILYVSCIFFSSCGAILSLIAYHLPS